MKISLSLVIPFMLVTALLFTGCIGPSNSELSVSADSPVRIGYTTLTVEAGEGLRDVSVTVGGLPADKISSQGNKHVFKYFISPYTSRDPIGIQKVNVFAFDSSGAVVTASTELNISYFAIGENIIGVNYYYFDEPPSPEKPHVEYPSPRKFAKDIVFGEDVNFFFEMDEGTTDRNSEIINAFQPIISTIASKGGNIRSYAVESTGGEWVSCLDTNSESIPASECKRMSEETPSIVLKLPDYPTSQGYIKDQRIELQPAPGQTKLMVESFVAMLTD